MTSGESIRTRVAVLEEQLRSMREATGLQAKEYERRLDELNHSHALAAARNAEFVSREVFENRTREVDNKSAAVAKLVYVGLGIVLALNALLFFILKGQPQ